MGLSVVTLQSKAASLPPRSKLILRRPAILILLIYLLDELNNACFMRSQGLEQIVLTQEIPDRCVAARVGSLRMPEDPSTKQQENYNQRKKLKCSAHRFPH